jgi:tetratricopeptide (TPR) repeat protein
MLSNRLVLISATVSICAFLCSLSASADLIYAKDDYRTGAMMALGQGKNKEALALMTKAIAKTPNDPELYVYRSDCYLRVNNPQKALADIQKAFALKKDRTFFPPVESTFYLNRGYVEVALKRDADALSDFKKAVEIFGAQEGAHSELAKLYEKKGQLSLALQQLESVRGIQKSEKRSTAVVHKDIARLKARVLKSTKK